MNSVNMKGKLYVYTITLKYRIHNISTMEFSVGLLCLVYLDNNIWENRVNICWILEWIIHKFDSGWYFIWSPWVVYLSIKLFAEAHLLLIIYGNLLKIISTCKFFKTSMLKVATLQIVLVLKSSPQLSLQDGVLVFM